MRSTPRPGLEIDGSSLEVIRLGCRDAPDEKGYTSDPRSQAKSVAFTVQGLRESERLVKNLFGASSG
jgi:hypothetical protein